MLPFSMVQVQIQMENSMPGSMSSHDYPAVTAAKKFCLEPIRIAAD